MLKNWRSKASDIRVSVNTSVGKHRFEPGSPSADLAYIAEPDNRPATKDLFVYWSWAGPSIADIFREAYLRRLPDNQPAASQLYKLHVSYFRRILQENTRNVNLFRNALSSLSQENTITVRELKQINQFVVDQLREIIIRRHRESPYTMISTLMVLDAIQIALFVHWGNSAWDIKPDENNNDQQANINIRAAA